MDNDRTTTIARRERRGPWARCTLTVAALCALAAWGLPGGAFCGDGCADLCGPACTCPDATVPAACGCCLDAAVRTAAQARNAAPRTAGPLVPPAATNATVQARTAAAAPIPVSCSRPPWSARPAVPVLRA